jgi:antitoxin MazE
MGNSRGIRLPNLFLDEVGLDEEVELEVQEGQVVIRLVPRPRRGWEKQFDGMTERGDDRLLDSKAFSLTSWDEEKWVW